MLHEFGPIPARAGVGLKPCHYSHILEAQPDLGWFEIHPENYMGEGGPPHSYLTAIREDYPLSIHGVSLSLGSATALDREHLVRLRKLVDRYAPGLVSEHLSWSAYDGVYLNDLLPLPYTEEALEMVCAHVEEAQDFLGRRLLIENPSVYLGYVDSVIPEPEFLATLARRTGCGLLLDVNNVYVSACNLGFNAESYLDAVPGEHVGEIHLAGHAVVEADGQPLRIDDHGSRVIGEVWALYERTVRRIGPRPTLIEWDTNIPAFGILHAEAKAAERIFSALPEKGPEKGPEKRKVHADAA